MKRYLGRIAGVTMLLALLAGCSTSGAPGDGGGGSTLPPVAQATATATATPTPDPKLVASKPRAFLAITQPSGGDSFVTTDTTVTLSGVASGDVTAVTVSGLSGTQPATLTAAPSGTSVGTWTTSALPLSPGDNVFTVTATSSNEATPQVITVTRNTTVTETTGLRATPDGGFVGNTLSVTFSLGLQATASIDGVQIVAVDAQGKTVSTLGSLTAGGADASGGTMFQGTFTLDSSTAQTLRYRVTATSGGEPFSSEVARVDVVTTVSASEVQAVSDVLSAIAAVYNAQSGGGAFSLPAAQAALQAALQRDDVASAGLTPDGRNLFVTLTNGMQATIPFVQREAAQKTAAQSASERAKRSAAQAAALPTVAIGKSERPGKTFQRGDAYNVACFGCMQEYFRDTASSFDRTVKMNSGGLVVTSTLIDSKVTPSTLRTQMRGHDLVYLDTHGGVNLEGVNHLVTEYTAEQMGQDIALYAQNPGSNQLIDRDLSTTMLDLRLGRLGWSSCKTKSRGKVSIESFLCVKPEFIRHHFAADRGLKDTVVIANFCYSTYSPALFEAFRQAGAKAYVGFTDAVLTNFATSVIEPFIRLLLSGATVRDACIVARDVDPNAEPNCYSMALGDLDMQLGPPTVSPTTVAVSTQPGQDTTDVTVDPIIPPSSFMLYDTSFEFAIDGSAGGMLIDPLNANNTGTRITTTSPTVHYQADGTAADGSVATVRCTVRASVPAPYPHAWTPVPMRIGEASAQVTVQHAPLAVDFLTMSPAYYSVPKNGGQVQLQVTAHFIGGSTKDVTRSVTYDCHWAQQTGTPTVDANGLCTIPKPQGQNGGDFFAYAVYGTPGQGSTMAQCYLRNTALSWGAPIPFVWTGDSWHTAGMPYLQGDWFGNPNYYQLPTTYTRYSGVRRRQLHMYVLGDSGVLPAPCSMTQNGTTYQFSAPTWSINNYNVLYPDFDVDATGLLTMRGYHLPFGFNYEPATMAVNYQKTVTSGQQVTSSGGVIWVGVAGKP